MTISSATNTAGPFAGNGSATAFPFAFKVFSRPELVFEVTDAAGTVSAKTLDSDFSVSLNADQDANPGGTITYPISGAPLATGETAIISTDLPYTQLTDITNAGGFLPQVIEDALDRNVRLMQQQAERTARSVRAPLGESMANLPPAAERANMLLTFDEDGDPVAVAPASQSATDLQILIASTATGNGTAMLGDSDVGGYYTGTNQAAINQELGVKTRGVIGLPADGTTVAAWAAANLTQQLQYPNISMTTGDVQLVSGNLVGQGQRLSVLTADVGASTVLKLGDSTNPNLWSWRRVERLTIDGNGKASDGIQFTSSTATPYYSGRWILDSLTIRNANRGIHKPVGSIGQIYYGVCISGCNYGYYGLSGAGAGTGMHPGCESWIMGEVSGSSIAGYYVNATQGGPGGTRITGTVFENNPGCGIVVENYATSYTPLVVDGVWFENNCTGGNVTLPVAGVVAPVDLHLANTAHAVLSNGILPKSRLVNGHLSVRNSFLSADKTTYSIDSASHVSAAEVHIDGGAHPIVIDSVVSIRRVLGNFAARWRGKPRTVGHKHTGTVIEAKSFANRNTEVFSGTTNVTGNIQADGRVYDQCLEISLPAGNTNNIGASVNITSGKWYFLSIDIKPVSGVSTALVINCANSGTAFSGLDDVIDHTAGRWTTICAAGQAGSTFTGRLTVQNGDAAAVVLRISAYQLVEFDTEPEMLAYINAGTYDPGATYPRVVYVQNASPATGTWAMGDRAINLTYAVGNIKSWVYSGSAWVGEGSW